MTTALDTDSRHFLRTLITAELQAQRFGPYLSNRGCNWPLLLAQSPSPQLPLLAKADSSPVIYPLSKLGDSSQQHPTTQRKQSVSHTSINHFCSYSVKRLLGEGGRDERWQGCGLWVRDQQEGRLGEPELKLLKEGAGMSAPHESIPPPSPLLQGTDKMDVNR